MPHRATKMLFLRQLLYVQSAATSCAACAIDCCYRVFFSVLQDCFCCERTSANRIFPQLTCCRPRVGVHYESCYSYVRKGYRFTLHIPFPCWENRTYIELFNASKLLQRWSGSVQSHVLMHGLPILHSVTEGAFVWELWLHNLVGFTASSTNMRVVQMQSRTCFCWQPLPAKPFF